MQLRLRFLLSSAGLMLLSQAPVAGAVSLVPMEEPVTTLVSPPNANPFVPSMQYAFAGSSLIATTVTATPLLCANTSAPLVAGTTLNPVYYSATGIGSTTPHPFVFGASPGSPNVSALASGATNVAMSPTSMTFGGDASGSLVCYGLDSSGAHRLTRDIFMDGSDGVPYNSSVVLSVFHVPTSSTDYYGYKIDVTLPPLPVDTDEFALIEGFDSAVFATTAGESTANIQGTWCQSLDGQSCAFASNPGNINFSYANGTNSSLVAPVSPNPAVQYHFIVKRYLRAGVASVPSTGAPVVIAALFSPNDLEENKLDDNVATGNNQIANAAPSVTQDATFTSFAGSLAALNENTDSGTMTFDISDSDTAESGGATLGAAVTLNLPGSISVPVTANCPTLLSNPGTTPVSRACTVDIPLNNGAFWNAQVGAALDGGFNVLATDTTNGSYANGLSASASIVVTDPLGKASSPVAVPVHIRSTVNNPPVVAFGGGMPVAQDSKQGGTSYPTYSCSIQTNNCGATFHVVELDGLVTALPGPAAALDELASQTTAVLDVQCGLSGENNPIFTNAPVVTQSAGSQTSYDLIFQLTSPPTAGSSLCSVSFTDQANSFPNGQTAKSATKQFRVVVNT